MIPGLAAPERVLARLEDIRDGGARGFAAAPGGMSRLFAVRQGGLVFVYLNACPHAGLPLDSVQDRFLTADGSMILCAAHGARFRIADGLCLHGPCQGERLEQVPATVVDGEVRIAADGGG